MANFSVDKNKPIKIKIKKYQGDFVFPKGPELPTCRIAGYDFCNGDRKATFENERKDFDILFPEVDRTNI